MNFSAKMIAGFLNGTVEGNPDVEVSDISKIEEGKPGTLSFLANPKYTNYLYTTGSSIILINKSFVPEHPVKATLIRVEDAYQAFASLLDMYNQYKPVKKGIEQPSYISQTARLGKDVYVGAFAYIGDHVIIGNDVKLYPHVYVGDNVIINDNTTLFSGVKIYHDCRIGAECIIHAGSVIGSDGFGFAPSNDKDYKKIPQIGNVIIEDHVEIGSNTTIDRSTMGSTFIRKGVKLDNLVHVAHNVEIGENTVVSAQSGFAGSSKIGKECMFGGQTGVAPHTVIGNGVKVGAQSGINATIKDNEVLIGTPAFNYNECMKSYVLFRKLPDLNRSVFTLEKQMKEIKQKS
jgi:UDP-3-O-[3-hydroxymyristoyl] glucosamine N-acyltransferase